MLAKVIAFEGLWARYIDALERLDVARAREVGPRSCGALRSRCIRGARREAERLRVRLEQRYQMDLGDERP
jgi:hypothetical protein